MTKAILILAANPKDTERLRLDREVREIDIGLQRARRRDEFALKQVWAARPVDVRRAMLDWKPNIVHFCGHGAGEAGIAFEDEAGKTRLVGTEALKGLFELFADTVQCVVLNACYSEVQAEAIAEHIAYVVGMKEGIGDAAALEFAVAFYDALGAGQSVEFAYKLARNAIMWTEWPEDQIPVLKSRRTSTEQTRPSLKYYVYISDMKVDMLYSQILQSMRPWAATGTELSSTDRPYSGTTYSKVEVVNDYLVKHVGVSSVDDDEIGPYFKGILPMRWGPFLDVYSGETTELAFFGGTSREKTVGLGGSRKHVIGHIDNEPTNSSSGTHAILSVLLKELAPELGIDPPPPYPPSLYLRRGVSEDERALTAVRVALSAVRVAVRNLSGPEQRVEFVAKTLLQGMDRGESVLLGTPIYVALAD